MKIIAVIPARIGSTRLPDKPLKDLNGKTLINRVYNKVKECDKLEDVIVATDSDKIFDEVISFGGKAMLTSSEHKSGTDRVAEVAEKIECDVIVNVQGDEPFIRKDMIERAIDPFLTDNFKGISTLKTIVSEKKDILNPNIVKVVCNKFDDALYFSRAPIPYDRDNNSDIKHYKHIGLYVYDKKTLTNYTNMKNEQLEDCEKLEQLRAMYNGIKIKVYEIEYSGIEINTPEDLKKALSYF